MNNQRKEPPLTATDSLRARVTSPLAPLRLGRPLGCSPSVGTTSASGCRSLSRVVSMSLMRQGGKMMQMEAESSCVFYACRTE